MSLWRCKGRWSQYLETRTWASRLRPGRPRSIVGRWSGKGLRPKAGFVFAARIGGETDERSCVCSTSACRLTPARCSSSRPASSYRHSAPIFVARVACPWHPCRLHRADLAPPTRQESECIYNDDRSDSGTRRKLPPSKEEGECVAVSGRAELVLESEAVLASLRCRAAWASRRDRLDASSIIQ